MAVGDQKAKNRGKKQAKSGLKVREKCGFSPQNRPILQNLVRPYFALFILEVTDFIG
jgi:hypothetical protein